MEIFGYDETTYDGTNNAFWRRVHPGDLEMVREAQRVAHETGSYYDVQHRIVRPDGVVRWIRERAQVEHAEDG
ncbi:MAG: PAS domain-containing protein, partial [Chloroflexi bacterium]